MELCCSRLHQLDGRSWGWGSRPADGTDGLALSHDAKVSSALGCDEMKSRSNLVIVGRELAKELDLQFQRFSFSRAAEEAWGIGRRLEELAARLKGADGFVELRGIWREAVKGLQVR